MCSLLHWQCWVPNYSTLPSPERTTLAVQSCGKKKKKEELLLLVFHPSAVAQVFSYIYTSV